MQAVTFLILILTSQVSANPLLDSVLGQRDFPECTADQIGYKGISTPRINPNEHNPFGLLDYKSELQNPETVLVTAPYPKHAKKVRVKKPLFQDPPTAHHVRQDSSLGCGFLAPLASILASQDGAKIIEERVYDDIETGFVYVLYQIPEEFRAKYPAHAKSVLVKLHKVRDKDGSWKHRKFTSLAKLFVHILERAFAEAFKAFPTSKDESDISPKTALQSILGVDTPIVFGTEFITESPTLSRPLPNGKKTLRSRFMNAVGVADRSDYAEALERPKHYPKIFNKHHYAIVSAPCKYQGKNGYWVMNTLGRENLLPRLPQLSAVLGYLFSNESSKTFFVPDDKAAEIFTSSTSSVLIP